MTKMIIITITISPIPKPDLDVMILICQVCENLSVDQTAATDLTCDSQCDPKDPGWGKPLQYL